MAATGAADGFFRCVYEGCISGGDTEIERRPYHRNCGCALHSKSNNKGRGNYICPNGLPKCKNVSYPIRRSWSEGSLVLAASNYSSPSTSPLIELGGSSSSAASSSRPPQYHQRHRSCINEEDLKV
ncbi:uncharacterized protein LOC116143602 [Pistacia vera]|uniref:Uncharacterized protein n=2 Tax=Pistacia TaxID=55512 RepID=A0ACC1ATS3_9ROSI|nr:uncharacterized protein LOC116122167 [Pistacia vera]XP_031284922.1 uncharacterized protein LOC116143602 [Pistacia vera]KAJ0029787.1 hypothetical protein Pint_14691 [Pistacia integerrima]KAJ0090000.1 hypothetical protein Patl1_14824 [Pistacia atlantica]